MSANHQDLPTTFRDTMAIAREFTDGGEADPREPIEVYLDVARLCVLRKLGESLDGVPISRATKEAVVESEAYALAQPAHLEDGGHVPVRLLEMLDSLGAFGFDCEKHCLRRKQLYDDTGVEYERQVEERGGIKAAKLTGGVFTLMAINEAYKATFDGDERFAPSNYKYSFMNGIPSCKTSPGCEGDCPLPEPGSERYQEVTVEIARRTIEDITTPAVHKPRG